MEAPIQNADAADVAAACVPVFVVAEESGDDGEGEVEVREERGEAEQREVEGVRVALVARTVRVTPPVE